MEGTAALPVTVEGLAAPGVQVEQRVRALTTGIRWRESVEEVLADARSGGKLGLFMHLLGDLEGPT